MPENRDHQIVPQFLCFCDSSRLNACYEKILIVGYISHLAQSMSPLNVVNEPVINGSGMMQLSGVDIG